MVDMYHKGENKIKIVPFEIRCTNCGSHNVEVFAYEYRDLGIVCMTCGSRLDDCASYNETTYREE